MFNKIIYSEGTISQEQERGFQMSFQGYAGR